VPPFDQSPCCRAAQAVCTTGDEDPRHTAMTGKFPPDGPSYCSGVTCASQGVIAGLNQIFESPPRVNRPVAECVASVQDSGKPSRATTVASASLLATPGCGLPLATLDGPDHQKVRSLWGNSCSVSRRGRTARRQSRTARTRQMYCVQFRRPCRTFRRCGSIDHSSWRVSHSCEISH
jgi:hypothetical protein